MTICKRSTIFVQSSWNFVKMIIPWGDYFHQVSWGLNKKCGFFTNGQFLSLCQFFPSDFRYNFAPLYVKPLHFLDGFSDGIFSLQFAELLREWLFCSTILFWFDLKLHSLSHYELLILCGIWPFGWQASFLSFLFSKYMTFSQPLVTSHKMSSLF